MHLVQKMSASKKAEFLEALKDLKGGGGFDTHLLVSPEKPCDKTVEHLNCQKQCYLLMVQLFYQTKYVHTNERT